MPSTVGQHPNVRLQQLVQTKKNLQENSFLRVLLIKLMEKMCQCVFPGGKKEKKVIIKKVKLNNQHSDLL